MTIALTTAGGLMTRIGRLMGDELDINFVRGGTITSPDYTVTQKSRIDLSVADYAAATARKDLIDGIYGAYTQFQQAQSSFLSSLQGIAQQTLIQMANDDTKLAQLNVPAAMALLVQQMKTNSTSVNSSTVSVGAQTSVGTPNGTPIFVGSVIDGVDGKNLEYMFPETIYFLVTADSTGTATKNQEPFNVTGNSQQTDTNAFNWPLGSGAQISMSLADAGTSSGAGNALNNSDFETFTNANIPDNWIATVGAIGTAILAGGSSNAYTGSNCLEFASDGSTLTAITQQFNTTPSTVQGSGGSATVLSPLTPYCLNLWLKMSATPAAGVMEFSLIDGNGATINDANGTANLFTKSLTAVSTTYVNVNGVFRLPANPPATVKLKVRISTAIDNTKNVFLDRMALNKMTQLYQGGPWLSGFSSNTIVLKNDQWSMAINNTYGGFQRLFERWYGMRSLGLKLPSSGSPTVNDNLIQ